LHNIIYNVDKKWLGGGGTAMPLLKYAEVI